MEYMDGGSLDLCLKKAIRIPESILGKICSTVSNKSLYSTFILNIRGLKIILCYFFLYIKKTNNIL